MQETQDKEKQFLDQARKGDARAFSGLVELHQERAVRAAYALLGNYEDARDAAQDAFVKAYENLDRFKGESRFYTWFYRILANVCKDFLRRKKWRQFSAWFGAGKEDGLDEAILQIPSPGKNAGEAVINRELGDQIFMAMEALPFQQKNAFTLRYIEGLSLEEVSVSMGLSVGGVKSTLWEAGQKMKKSLGGLKSWEDV